MNEFKSIEEQIAELRKEGTSEFYYPEDAELIQRAADTMQSMLEVVRAVDEYEQVDNTSARLRMRKTLAKLKE